MSSMKSENWEQYLKTLLECPVCLQTIESLPIFQCCNGHIVCKDCLQRLDNCPVCRNEPICIRNLQLEQLIEKKERYLQPILHLSWLNSRTYFCTITSHSGNLCDENNKVHHLQLHRLSVGLARRGVAHSIALVTQPMMQSWLNWTELRSMDYSI